MKTNKNAAKLLKKNRGQGMTEYIIIVALVAIAAIGVITLFGDNIRHMFGNAADSLGGATTMTYSYTSAGGKATTYKGLSGFSNDNGSTY
jgi:Flp pilus assembly pilin Flp